MTHWPAPPKPQLSNINFAVSTPTLFSIYEARGHGKRRSTPVNLAFRPLSLPSPTSEKGYVTAEGQWPFGPMRIPPIAPAPTLHTRIHIQVTTVWSITRTVNERPYQRTAVTTLVASTVVIREL